MKRAMQKMLTWFLVWGWPILVILMARSVDRNSDHALIAGIVIGMYYGFVLASRER